MRDCSLRRALQCVRTGLESHHDAQRLVASLADSDDRAEAQRLLNVADDEFEEARDLLRWLVEDVGPSHPASHGGAGRDTVGALVEWATDSLRRELELMRLVTQMQGLVSDYRALVSGAEVVSDGS